MLLGLADRPQQVRTDLMGLAQYAFPAGGVRPAAPIPPFGTLSVIAANATLQSILCQTLSRPCHKLAQNEFTCRFVYGLGPLYGGLFA